MSATRITGLVCVIATLFCAMPLASAATLTTFTGGDVGEGLDLDGTFYYAIHAAPSGVYTARDATFVPRPVAGAAFNFPASTPFGSPNYGASANDVAIANVNQYVIFGEPATINLAVVPGQQYKLQLLYNEACCNRHFDVNIEGSTVMSDVYPGGLQGGGPYNQSAGVVFTHSFTATDTTLNIDLNAPGTGSDPNPIFDALTLETALPVFLTPVTGGDIGEGISVDPTKLVVAVDVGGSGGNVHGINFVSEAAAAGSVTLNSDHITAGSVNYGSTPNDLALNAIMSDIRYSDGPNNVTADIAVTPGRFYEVGLLIDSSAYNARTQDITIDGVTIVDNLPVAGPTGPATWLVRYQFHATSSSIHVVLGPSGLVGGNAVGGDNNAVLNALYLQLVPEPSSLTLLGFGAIGLFRIARRRRA